METNYEMRVNGNCCLEIKLKRDYERHQTEI